MLFIGIVLIANSDNGKTFFHFVNYIPGQDKTAHFALFFTISLVVNMLLNFKYLYILNKKVLLGSIIVFSIAFIEEFSQLFLVGRTFDLIDLLADFLGVFSVLFVVKFFKRDFN